MLLKQRLGGHIMNYFEYEYANFLSVNLLLNNLNIHKSYIDFLKEHYPLIPVLVLVF